jgi:hypothetical protein
MAPIQDLSRLLEHDGIPLLLATYPQPWQVSADATPIPPIRDQYAVGHSVHLNDRPFKKLAAFALEHDIPFLNATNVFRQDATPSTLFRERLSLHAARASGLRGHPRPVNCETFHTAH